MVAFNMQIYNWQGHGKSLWLMHGMFRANGGCAYVKKLDFLSESSPRDPRIELPVKIILKVGIAGVPADTIMKKEYKDREK
ncbi:hypothetical protein JCGZ_11451 [Jatropha curcas]|uniref:PI-PLC Y-box domain-containing protein n=1 Tax=Jatropha curcas TaxID=180498 RepID=A0A067KFN8_JATCU|nr:hypothetical protein JCGZ_11451 [Jatropha curcas]